jgi:predicted metalloprotease with PDZ domain
LALKIGKKTAPKILPHCFTASYMRPLRARTDRLFRADGTTFYTISAINICLKPTYAQKNTAMKTIILSLLLALIGTDAGAQTLSKTKTKTADGKETKVIQERMIPPPSKPTADRPAVPSKLGVSVLDDDEGGALVEYVEPNSPAADAGIMTGDVIVKLNNSLISSSDDLVAAMTGYNRGDYVTISYERNDRPLRSVVLLGTSSSSQVVEAFDLNNKSPEDVFSSSTYTGELPRSRMYNDEKLILPYGRPLGIRGIETGRGLEVMSVRIGSAADAAGLHTGDTIVRLDGQRIWKAEDIAHILNGSKQRVSLEFLRKGNLFRTDLRFK